jgi:hypothetical protein
MNPALKYLAVSASIMVVMFGCATVGWTLRGWRCETAMAAYKAEQSGKAEDQRKESRLIEIKQEAAADKSTQRLDEQQEAHQKETVYVEKKVIQYRDRWRDRDCQRPDDWVQLYNESLFGTDPAMPQAGQAGSAPIGTAMLLPTGRD